MNIWSGNGNMWGVDATWLLALMLDVHNLLEIMGFTLQKLLFQPWIVPVIGYKY